MDLTQLSETVNAIPEDDANVKVLKNVVKNLIQVIDTQTGRIKLLEEENGSIKNQVIRNVNHIDEMADRIRDLEILSETLSYIQRHRHWQTSNPRSNHNTK